MAGADMPVGHFNMPLLTNEDPFVEVTVQYKQDTLLHYFEQKINRPERHAIRNLLGVLAFWQKNTQGAKDYFQEILGEDEDPYNINAMANLNYVESQITGVAAANLDGPDLDSETGKMIQARCYAEQAYAHIFELYHETVTCDRYKKALELYTKATELAGDLVDAKEKEDWQFGIGLASNKIFKQCKKEGRNDEARQALNSATSNFGAIINSDSADDAMKCDALLHFGLVCQDASRCQEFRIEEPRNLHAFIGDPKLCLNKALELAPNSPTKARIYARLATFRDRDNKFTEAMELLDKSIRLDGSMFNFHAYSTRARVRLKQYKYCLSNRNQQADEGLLAAAKTDLETVLEGHHSPWDFRNLAEVFLLLAKRSSGNLSREYIQSALDYCDKSAACQDGADSPDHHRIYGECLCFNGEHQRAKESFQRGVQCEQTTGWKCGNVKLLAIEESH